MSAFDPKADIGQKPILQQRSRARRRQRAEMRQQNFGLKSQDQAGPFHIKQQSDRTMSGKDKMEIKIAFLALAFFAAFMAARSLTAYFQKK